MKSKLYKSDSYVSSETGFTLRMNYSSSENFELHHHDYYEFFLTLSGNAIQVINGKKQSLPEGNLVLVRPGDVHTYIKEGEFSFVNLTFTIDTMKNLCSYFGKTLENIISKEMPPTVILNRENFNALKEKLFSLNTISLTDHEKANLKMKLILTDIIALIIEGDIDKPVKNVPIWLTSLILHCQKAENLNITLQDMSAFSGKSREHISRTFKKFYGLSVGEFLTEQKLNYSANLLLSSNLAVIDICYESGFQNLSWFYRKFKEKFSITPYQFRKNMGIQ